MPWLTAGDNIGLVLKAGMTESEAKAKTRQVLDLLHLSEAYGMMPSELSGGMQRRLAIGRALAYDAEILLLDEPFKGMDEALKAEILPKLAESWQTTGKTVILVTHDLAEAHKISRNIFELSGKPITWSRCPSDIETQPTRPLIQAFDGGGQLITAIPPRNHCNYLNELINL